MEGYGLTLAGFLRPRLPEIQASIVAELREALGLDLDTSPDSLTGQFVAVFADREAAMWEEMERVYLAMYPLSAQGAALDNAVAFSGVFRALATRARVVGRITAAPGTLIPAGSAVRAAGDDARDFLLFDSRSVTLGSAAGGAFRVDDLSVVMTVGAQRVTATGASTVLTAAALAAALNAASPDLGDATATGNVVYFKRATEAAISLSGAVALILDVLGDFRSSDFGAVAVPAGTLTRIQSGLPGWVAVNNDAAGTPGRAAETDAELRARYTTGVYRLGAGTLPSIRANLELLTGVTRVRVYENDGTATDADGRPPGAIEAVVSGGVDAEIAAELWRLKPAGQPTHGLLTTTIQDEDGVARAVKHTRPVEKPVWVRLTLTRYTEEPLPDAVAARVAAALAAAGNALDVGEDVLAQRLIGPTFGAVTGLKSVGVELTFGTTTTPGTYGTADLAVGVRERAVFDATRVTVIGP